MPWIVGGAIALSSAIGAGSAASAGKNAAKNIKQGRDFAVNNSGLTQYKDAGLGASKTINDLLGNNSGDPTASKQAFQKYLDSTGYQFQQGQGIDAINANQAASGMLNSGDTLRASLKFGQGLGASYFNNYLNQQSQVANRGANASANLATIYSGTGNQLAANDQNTAEGLNNSLQGGLASATKLFGNRTGTAAAQAAAPASQGTVNGGAFGANFGANVSSQPYMPQTGLVNDTLPTNPGPGYGSPNFYANMRM